MNPFPLSPIITEHHLKTLAPLLSTWRTQGKIPHALLLTGPTGIGKRDMAYFISAWLLCANPNPTHACGTCSTCKAGEKNNWVDFKEIAPTTGEDTGKRGSIKIEPIREITAKLGFSSVGGKYKIILISNAETLTPQAANALLKTLEEPPPGLIFILTVSDSTLLLPTIASRTQKIRLHPLQPDAILKILSESKIPPEKAAIASALSQGSVLRAKTLADDEHWEFRKKLILFLNQPAIEMNSVLEEASEDFEKMNLTADLFETFIRDLLELETNTVTSHSIQNTDSIDTFRRFLKKQNQGKETLFRLMDQLTVFKSRLPLPMNRKIVLQDFLTAWFT